PSLHAARPIARQQAVSVSVRRQPPMPPPEGGTKTRCHFQPAGQPSELVCPSAAAVKADIHFVQADHIGRDGLDHRGDPLQIQHPVTAQPVADVVGHHQHPTFTSASPRSRQNENKAGGSPPATCYAIPPSLCPSP